MQLYVENPTRQKVGERKTTIGEYIGDLLVYLAKKGPAAGIIVIVATQRPDSQTLPSSLRAVLGSRFALRVMDWRDSNIILGEQMNTRGYDASKLLPSHKGVGILRPDGETDGGDLLAQMVRCDYMPNADWRAICERGRALREAEGTLSGHAAGDVDERGPDVVMAAAVAGALGPGSTAGDDHEDGEPVPVLPEPLASVVAYLGDGLHERSFVPTAELVAELGVESTAFGREMRALGCSPIPGRVTDADGTTRQARGYPTEDLRAAVDRHR